MSTHCYKKKETWPDCIILNISIAYLSIHIYTASPFLVTQFLWSLVLLSAVLIIVNRGDVVHHLAEIKQVTIYIGISISETAKIQFFAVASLEFKITEKRPMIIQSFLFSNYHGGIR